MKFSAIWGCLVGSLLAISSPRAQTLPAVGATAPPIKAVPQTERKPKPVRVDDRDDFPTVESATPSGREAPASRSARAPRGARAPHTGRPMGPHGHGPGR